MWELARRDFRARYAGSAFGLAWAILEPLVQFTLYLTVFSYFLGMRLEGRPGMASFGLYLLSGLVPFLAFQECLVRSVHLAREQAQLVRHANVPLEAILAGSLAAIFVRNAVMLGFVVLAALVTGSFTWASVPWLLLGVALVAVAAFGLGLALVPSGAFLPDLGQFVATGLSVLFFLTPIVYDLKVLPARFARWMVANPLAGMLGAFRAGVLGLAPAPAGLAVATGFAIAVLILGSWVFKARALAVRDVV